MFNTNFVSDALSTLSIRSETPGPTVISPNRLGDIAEQYVKLLSHWKGCEVFQNVGCTGPTDIVIIHPKLGQLQVDVKCRTWSQGCWKCANAFMVKPPVYPVAVTPNGDIADWEVSWVQGRIPEGWEDFWTNDNRYYKTTSTQPTHQCKLNF